MRRLFLVSLALLLLAGAFLAHESSKVVQAAADRHAATLAAIDGDL
ncbi:MAG: hypothetical protein ACREB0_00170 [Sphingopyxis sp.]